MAAWPMDLVSSVRARLRWISKVRATEAESEAAPFD